MGIEDPRERRVVETLDRLGIPFDRFEHPPVATVDEATVHWAAIEAAHCKALFLRNKKGDCHYLVVLGYQKKADLQTLVRRLGEDRLSFGSADRLLARLGLTPGSVSPFGLINDPDHTVRVVIDTDLKHAAAVTFHPNVNTATLRLARQDFERFLASTGHSVQWIAL
jgi:Ala-tRNA(Pro) deacylase